MCANDQEIPTHRMSKKNIYKLLNCALLTTALLLTGNPALGSVIDDIKADMQLNEAKLLKAPIGPTWATQAQIDMGAGARGDATPSWWNPDDKSYKSASFWNAITPWFVIYPGEQHNAKNVRVILSGIQLHILEHSTNEWRLINISQTEPLWETHEAYVSPSTAYTRVDKRTEPDGRISYKLNAGLNPIHGGIRKFAIDGSDVKAVYVNLTTELIVDDPTKEDDRENAQILVSVGADYYPSTEHRVGGFTLPHKWVPAVGGSRYGLVRTQPRVHHMATIDPPGPLNNLSPFPNNGKVISISEFKSNPPSGIIIDAVGIIDDIDGASIQSTSICY